MLCKCIKSTALAMNSKIKHTFLSFTLVLTVYHGGSALKRTALKVGAFNIQQFGDSLMSNEHDADKIVYLVRRFDILAIIEVRDSDLSAVDELRSRLGSRYWAYVASDLLGRSSYKERVVYFYRKNNLRIMGTYLYDDSRHDYFERDPFGVEIKYYSRINRRNKRVVLVGIHTRPRDTPAELEALPGVMEDAKERFPRSRGVIALGDFNADCGYLNGALRESIEIFNSDIFQSLIGHEADTTVSGTNCSYDRVVIEARDDVIPDRPEVIKFDDLFGLTRTRALRISDHYPIRFRLN